MLWAKLIELGEHQSDRRREKSLPINRCTHSQALLLLRLGESQVGRTQLFGKKQQQASGPTQPPTAGPGGRCEPRPAPTGSHEGALTGGRRRPAPRQPTGAGVHRNLSLNSPGRRGAARCHGVTHNSVNLGRMFTTAFLPGEPVKRQRGDERDGDRCTPHALTPTHCATGWLLWAGCGVLLLLRRAAAARGSERRENGDTETEMHMASLDFGGAAAAGGFPLFLIDGLLLLLGRSR